MSTLTSNYFEGRLGEPYVDDMEYEPFVMSEEEEAEEEDNNCPYFMCGLCPHELLSQTVSTQKYKQVVKLISGYYRSSFHVRS